MYFLLKLIRNAPVIYFAVENFRKIRIKQPTDNDTDRNEIVG